MTSATQKIPAAPNAIHWFGRTPSHWPIKRLKRLVKFVGGGTPSKENLSYWGGDIPWVSPKDMSGSLVEDTQDHLTADAVRSSATNLVEAGAVLLVVRSGILRRRIPVAINSVTVALNQDMKALVPSSQVCASYLAYLISGYSSELLELWRKTGATVESIEFDYLANTNLPVPPLNEQQGIAAFLDHRTAQIDSLVKKKERLIKLLEEKRTALISHAVTKGLNPNVPMKDSGVEWLGEIPSHWAVASLSKITSSRCDGPFGSGLKSEHYTNSGARVVRLQNIAVGAFRSTDAVFIDQDYFERELRGHGVVEGDLIVAGLGDENHPVGRACVAPADLGPALVKADCFRFRIDRRKADPQFLADQLSCFAGEVSKCYSAGSTRSRMNLSLMSSRKVAVPPPDEQRLISEHTRQAKVATDALIELVNQAILTLNEYRTAFISAAVTGKIDVRNEA